MADTSFREARVEDRALITAVLHRFARLANYSFPPDELDLLFAPGATYRLPDGSEVDARENMRRFGKGGEFETKMISHLTTVDITFVGEDEAHVESYFLGMSRDPDMPIDHWATWQDIFRRQPDGAWLLAFRDIPADGFGHSSRSMMIPLAEGTSE